MPQPPVIVPRSLPAAAAVPVTVREQDGSPSVAASTVEFSGATVTSQGNGVARVTVESSPAQQATPLTVTELDGAPSIAATTLRFPNGTLTDDGSGVATYTPAAAPAAPTPTITIREQDGSPAVTASVLEFATGTLTDQGNGVARYAPPTVEPPTPTITVRDIDGTPSVSATTVEFTNGTVADQGAGVARVTIAVPSNTVTVTEADGSPSVAATTIRFPNGTVTDNGGGTVTYTPGASAAAVTVAEVDGTPSVSATTIQVANGYLSDQGGGTARITPDPDAITRSRYSFDEDFLAASGWTGGLVGTASGGSVANGTGDTNHPGVIALSTGTTATGRYGVASHTAAVRLGGGRAYFMTILRVPTLSNATDTFSVRAGFGDSVAGEFTDGAFFRYTHGTASGVWQCVTRSNNVEATPINTAITVLAATWYRLEIEVNNVANSAQFWINGTSMGTITSSIPAGAGRETGIVAALIIKSLGTAARTLDLDETRCVLEFTTAR